MSGAPRLALHQRISADLAGRIRSGDWPPGARIPFEHELMVSYGCARATANKAVQALADAGLIVRRRRAGSFVAPRPIQSAVMEIPELQAEVAARGQAYGYRLLSRRRRELNASVADEARLASGGEVLDLTCLHSADERPFALEQRLIRLASTPGAERADFTHEAPGAWLLTHVAWSGAEHRIAAIAADAATAARLDLEVGAPCLSLKRWTWREDEGVTLARQIFPGEAFELVARFAPKTFA
jgi:GntR family histidine utilization transcriptional repressor